MWNIRCIGEGKGLKGEPQGKLDMIFFERVLSWTGVGVGGWGGFLYVLKDGKCEMNLFT